MTPFPRRGEPVTALPREPAKLGLGRAGNRTPVLGVQLAINGGLHQSPLALTVTPPIRCDTVKVNCVYLRVIDSCLSLCPQLHGVPGALREGHSAGGDVVVQEPIGGVRPHSQEGHVRE